MPKQMEDVNLFVALEIIPFSVKIKMEMLGRNQKKSMESQPVPVMNGIETFKHSNYFYLKNKCCASFGKNRLTWIGCFFLISACSEPNSDQGSTKKKLTDPVLPQSLPLRE